MSPILENIIMVPPAKVTCVTCQEFKEFFAFTNSSEQGFCLDCYNKFNAYKELTSAAKEILDRYYVETLPMYMKLLKESFQKIQEINNAG